MPSVLISPLGIREYIFSHEPNPGHPRFHNLQRFRAPGPLQFSEHRHSDSGEGAKKSARHSSRSERLEHAKGTHCQELSLGSFIRGKIRRELYHLYEHVLSKTRTARINGSHLISVLDSFSCECCP